MAPISKGAHRGRDTFMKLPEPDYYTLSEAAERWGSTIDTLLRLGIEEKLHIGVATDLISTHVICFDENDQEKIRSITDEEMKAFGLDSLPMIRHGAYIGVECLSKIRKSGSCLLLDVLPIDPNERVPLPPGCHLYVNHSFDNNHGYLHKYSKNDLIIPKNEIHRIDHLHETAQRAVDIDVLGTKEREKLQAIIAAMAEVLANTAPRLKNGSNPNAQGIAAKIAEMIPDRQVDTIRKAISEAINAGLIQKAKG